MTADGRFRTVAGHPRLSVNSVSSYGQPLAADIAMWGELGVDHVALILPKIDEIGWDAAAELVTGAGLRVSTIFGPTYRRLDADRSLGWWEEDQRRTVETIEWAASIGAASVYVCSGAAPALDWDEYRGLLDPFIAANRTKLARIYADYLTDDRNPLISQPESLLVFERIEHDRFRLAEWWGQVLPSRMLTQMADMWGKPVEVDE